MSHEPESTVQAAGKVAGATSPYDQAERIPVRRALISVSDKTGLLDLAGSLTRAGVEIVSTGSTAKAIKDAGYPVTEVSQVTGFPESLDGRVKTLHPAIHAGILADLRLESHRAQLASLGIQPFELVVVNLYPFRETVASGAPSGEIIEKIDIGGPTLVRASAKNHANVAIVVSPAGYALLAQAVTAGGTTLAQRQRLAAEAFAHTASYDAAVAGWFAQGMSLSDDLRSSTQAAVPTPSGAAGDGEQPPALPAALSLTATQDRALRYGENSHQRAALYRDANGRGIAQATQLQGKEMSYNNFVDADAAVRAAWDFDEPAVAIVKHANPCGIAVAQAGAEDSIASAHLRAHACDSKSAFGGVIAANRTVTAAMAQTVAGIFTEVLVAPAFDADALEILATKKNLRLLQLPTVFARDTVELRQISGGMLAQTPDTFDGFSSVGWQRMSGAHASDETLADLEFAWRACRSVKSNAILLATGGASVGVGMGQVNRVDSCHLAVTRAGDRAAGSVAASDAFFPFADGLQVLIDAGVRAVVQPGGSMRDAEVIAAAQAADVTMYFTGERHFFH